MNNGWIRLHRQILENEIFRHDRTAWHVFEVLLVLANKNTGQWSGGTYQLAELCGINKPTLYKAILRLEKANMINRVVNTRYTVYNIVNWCVYQADGKRSVNAKETQSNTLTRIKNKEINSTNVLLAKPGNEEINKMFDYWQGKVGYPITSKTTLNRRAAYNLQRKYKDDVYKLIDGVALAQGEKFAPQISDFSELQSKLNNLLAWGKKRTDSRMEIIA